MKKITALFTFLTTLSLCGWGIFKQAHHPRYERLQTGDIVFQDTGAEQGAAVRAATKSPYTHCGVVVEIDQKLYVFEAVQPVQLIPLKTWKARSKIFHARRLKDPSKLTDNAIVKAARWGENQIGKDYDLHFKWGDNELYCSELVWKVYQQSTGLRLCEPRSFQSYFLDDPAVRRVVEQRYGNLENLPKKEPVVAPSDLANSPFLVEVPRANKKS